MQLPRPQHRGQPAWRDIGHADALQQSASRHSGAMRKHRARNREVPGSLRAPERRTGPVNAFLTINWAKIAELKKLSVVERVRRGSTRGRQCGASLSKRWSFGRRADVWRP